jgi:putative transposase
MTAVCETFGVARSNMAERVKQRPSKARGRPPLADDDLVDEIKAIISEMPTYGYRRACLKQLLSSIPISPALTAYWR